MFTSKFVPKKSAKAHGNEGIVDSTPWTAKPNQPLCGQVQHSFTLQMLPCVQPVPENDIRLGENIGAFSHQLHGRNDGRLDIHGSFQVICHLTKAQGFCQNMDDFDIFDLL